MTAERALSRRAVLRSAVWASALGATGAGALSGCTPSRSASTGRRTAGPASARDVVLLTGALADEERLLAYCSAVAARHPAIATSVAPLRRVQRDHVAVMRRALGRSSPYPAASSPATPRRLRTARSRLLALVTDARDRRLADCLAAESGRLARMLASVAASHAVTLDLLTGAE